MEERTQARRGGLVGPLILVSCGLVFLLNNLGILSWNVWQSILQMWPVLLIAIGVDLLLRNRMGGGAWATLFSLVVLGMVVSAAGAVILLAPGSPTVLGQRISAETAVSGDDSRPFGIDGGLRSEKISQPLESAERAEVDLKLGVGRVDLRAMPEAGGLVEGSLLLGRDERPVQEFQIRGGTAYYRLRTESQPVSRGAGPREGNDRNWELRFNPDLPMTLSIDGGVGSAVLDLSGLRLTELELQSGLGDTTVMLPRQGQLKANIEGGIGKTTISIPAGVPARVHLDRGLTSMDVSGNFQPRGDLYLSPGYEDSANALDVLVRGGIGKIIIQKYEPR